MRYPKTLVAAAIVAASLLVLASPGRAQDGTPRAADMFLQVDDLVTATGQGDYLIRLRPRKRGKGYQPGVSACASTTRG